jgi:hypothetical protein
VVRFSTRTCETLFNSALSQRIAPNQTPMTNHAIRKNQRARRVSMPHDARNLRQVAATARLQMVPKNRLVSSPPKPDSRYHQSGALPFLS